MDKVNLDNIRQAFGNTVYNWKVHEVSAERLNIGAFWFKFFNILLVSLVLIVLFLQVVCLDNLAFKNYKDDLNCIGVILSVLEIILLISFLSFGFEERVSHHKKSALGFRNIRELYINLITDTINNLDITKITERRDALLREFQTICNLSPQTSRASYRIAQNRLKPFIKKGFVNKYISFVFDLFSYKKINDEDFTISDAEIDRFLPKRLQKKNLEN